MRPNLIDKLICMCRFTYKSMEYKYKNLSFGEKSLMENIVGDIEDKYGIAADECLHYLQTLQKSTEKRVRRPKIPLPFYNVIHEDKCQAIVLNHRLYTQCRCSISEGVYCGRHAKNRRWGDIRDRLQSSWKPNGPALLSYEKVIEKLNIDSETVRRAIKDLNIQLNSI